MLDTHHQFWNRWAADYQAFSETIEPYRAAQRALAENVVIALGEAARQPTLTILDAGGGAGNLIQPLLAALAQRRGNLTGVRYTLTDGAKDMTTRAEDRAPQLRRLFPDVVLNILHKDTLSGDFDTGRDADPADLVVSSWNIEYYPADLRLAIVQRLVRLAKPSGLVAFSSMVELPAPLTLRGILMPLGQAQVTQALLTGGPRQMRKVIACLRKIAEFGAAATASDFPAKPTLAQLHELAADAGLSAVTAEYHLFGTSVMLMARKDGAALPTLPHGPVSAQLFGRPGYEGYRERATFWSYLGALLRRPPTIG